jgi:hypothetical protein
MIIVAAFPRPTALLQNHQSQNQETAARGKSKTYRPRAAQLDKSLHISRGLRA